VLNVLHITPHLGGGVGKALLSLAQSSLGKNVTHTFVLLEEPIKKQFFDELSLINSTVYISPKSETVDELINSADIVQVEWWNHPLLFKFLCERQLPAMRLLIWCHVSGLHTPLIPVGLIKQAARFLFTSTCSLAASYIEKLEPSIKQKTGVVSSGTGLNAFDKRDTVNSNNLNVGYIGTLNFSKLHPDFVDFVSSVPIKDFSVTLWGDTLNQELISSQCHSRGKEKLVQFAGYTADVKSVLSSLDVLIYLLNPKHYGTAENILLEAMSVGVIPIVLNNPAEMAIVKHNVTGLIVDSNESFSDAVMRLTTEPLLKEQLSNQAIAYINENYTQEKMYQNMFSNYQATLENDRCSITFTDFLGNEPIDWFLACQSSTEHSQYDTEELSMDKTKGSIFHFMHYFPNDESLQCFEKEREMKNDYRKST